MPNRVFKLPEVKNHVPRTGYDLSERSIRSTNVGMLLPVYHRHLVPGDHFKIDFSSFTRTKTLNRASFGRFKEYVDWFFVPFKSIWKYSDDFLANIPNQTTSPAANSVPGAVKMNSCPCVNFASLYDTLHQFNDVQTVDNFDEMGVHLCYGFDKILDMCGYGNHITAYTGNSTEVTQKLADISKAGYINIWNLAAYQAIYQNFFRNDNWELADPTTFNFDYLNSSSFNINANQLDLTTYPSLAKKLCKLRYADYPKDLFTGLYPNSQFGSVSVVSSLMNAAGDFIVKSEDGSTPNYAVNLMNSVDGRLVLNNNVKTPAHIVQQLSILDIRRSEALQRWKEIQLVNKKNYKSQMSALFGENIPYRRPNIVDYLGGSTNIINIQDVTATSDAGNATLGDLAGKGIGATQSNHIEYECKEHGVLMAIYHVLPVLEYSSTMLDKENTIVSNGDYYNPVFGNIGLESVRRQQLAFAPITNDTRLGVILPDLFSTNEPVGYGSRYLEYKSSVDKVYGDFACGRPMENWSLPQNVFRRFSVLSSSSIPQLGNMNYLSFKCYPSDTSDTFINNLSEGLYEDSQDQFYLVLNCDVKAVRPMDVDGLPY